jgi:hypothetical protein
LQEAQLNLCIQSLVGGYWEVLTRLTVSNAEVCIEKYSLSRKLKNFLISFLQILIFINNKMNLCWLVLSLMKRDEIIKRDVSEANV